MAEASVVAPVREALGAAIEVVGTAIQTVAAAIILVAVAIVLACLAIAVVRGKVHEALPHERLRFGRGLILGLDLLIAADVLGTIVAPTLDDLAKLGGIVILRVILTFAIEWEMRLTKKEERERRKEREVT